MKCLLRFDAWKYGRMEARLCREADLITAISPVDGAYYRSSLPSKEVVDLLPGYSGGGVAPAGVIDASVPRRVVIVGSFEWVAKKHNLREFLAEAGSLFDRAGIEVQIVGKTDTAFVDEIVRRFPFCRFAANVRSVTPYLLSARLGLIVEELGGGFKLKALEYVFNGLPVAALDGAVEGMPLEAGREILKAPDLPGLVEKVAGKIDDFAWLKQARERALESAPASSTGRIAASGCWRRPGRRGRRIERDCGFQILIHLGRRVRCPWTIRCSQARMADWIEGRICPSPLKKRCKSNHEKNEKNTAGPCSGRPMPRGNPRAPSPRTPPR